MRAGAEDLAGDLMEDARQTAGIDNVVVVDLRGDRCQVVRRGQKLHHRRIVDVGAQGRPLADRVVGFGEVPIRIEYAMSAEPR